jgi:hypothetical protein
VCCTAPAASAALRTNLLTRRDAESALPSPLQVTAPSSSGKLSADQIMRAFRFFDKQRTGTVNKYPNEPPALLPPLD